jgi:5,10-methylenetetrahydrofolate reductase
MKKFPWVTGFRTGINRTRQKATEITTRLVAEIAPMVQGVHFMPLGWSDVVVRVIEQIQEKQRNFARAAGA